MIIQMEYMSNNGISNNIDLLSCIRTNKYGLIKLYPSSNKPLILDVFVNITKTGFTQDIEFVIT